MVNTRSGRDHELFHAIVLSKVIAKAGKAHSKRLLGPKSHAKKTPAVPPLSAVSQSSRGRQKASSAAKPETKQGTSNARAGTETGLSSRSPTVLNTANLALVNASPVSAEKQRQVAEYAERETDAARNASVVIKFGSHRYPPFKPVQAGFTKKYPKNYFSNSEKWKVGEHPFITWIGPEVTAYREVFGALRDHHETKQKIKEVEEDNKVKEDVEVLSFTPMEKYLLPEHAYAGNAHQFGAVIEPMISCATSNNNQKHAADSLRRNLSYQNGQQRSTPNWHRLTDISEYELATILRAGGRHTQNARNIMLLFYEVMEYNIQKRGLSYDKAKKIHEEAKGAADYTDGLLSIDFLVGLDMQQMFDTLVKYRGLGAKTAACIMCFSFNFAIFAVDTHVFRLAQWLRWVPRDCTVEDAFKFLTHVIPPELHRALHQVLWHHGQLCFRCGEKSYFKVNDPKWIETVCPLEQFYILRFSNWNKNKSSADLDNEQISKEITVLLKTDKDIAAAEAAGHKVLEEMDNDASGAELELSNVKKTSNRGRNQSSRKARSNETVKGYLVLTHTDATAFKKFRRLSRKAKDPEEKVIYPLSSDEDVADAEAAGHEVLSMLIDDSFGAQPELSNIKSKKKRFLEISNAEKAAFKQFQRERKVVTTTLKTRESKVRNKNRATNQQTLTGMNVFKVQKTTTMLEEQITTLEVTTTTETLGRGALKEKDIDEDMIDDE